MKKVLVLGAKGNLGTQIMREIKDGFALVGWDRGDFDITDFALLDEKLRKLKPEIIINTVAYNAVDECEKDEEFKKAQILNGQAVGALADAAVKLGAILVHFSTDHVFDGEKQSGYSEYDIPAPINRYGESKLMGEEALLERAGQGLKHYLIRTSKLFGPRGESDLTKESFFDMMLRLSQGKKEIKAVSGEEISCFTYMKDLARATQNLIESEKPYGVYHIVNSGPASWYEGARLLFEYAGVTDVRLIPISGKELPRPAKRPRNSTLVNTKLEPLQGWDMALKEYLNNK